MPEDLTTDLLAISGHDQPPAAETLLRGVTAAGLGTAEYTSTEGGSGDLTPPAATGRRRLGTYTLRAPTAAASGRIVVRRYVQPVTTGMGEAALALLAHGLRPEDARILRQGTISLDLRVSYTPGQALPALDWGLRLLRLLLDLTEGVALDPAAQRCLPREGLARGAASPHAHVQLHREPWGAETHWLHTHGLQKFGRPELELVEVPVALEEEARSFLTDLIASLAGGATLSGGQEIEVDDAGSVVALSTQPDADHQAPYSRLRLADVPAAGERQGQGVARFLARAALADAQRRAQSGDGAGALETLDRILSATPDDCTALSLKAQLHLQAGQIGEALTLGELMSLRVPADYRGPLTIGVALAAMGRYVEALRAVDRAIEREPEAAEAFAARARIHRQLGHASEAAADEARSVYLLA